MVSAERIEINSSPGLRDPVISFIKPRIVGSVSAEAWIAIPAIPPIFPATSYGYALIIASQSKGAPNLKDDIDDRKDIVGR